MGNLSTRLWARHRGFLIACALLLGGFQFVLCAIVASMNLGSALEQILTFAPPIIRSMLEQSLLGGTNSGVLAFGWNHPVTHAVMTAVAITLAARAIAGEIENGAIELVLAQPVSRTAYLGGHVIFAVSAIVIIACTGALGTAIGQRVFALEAFDVQRLAELLLNMILLQSAIYAITLLASAWGREAGRVAIAGVLVAVVSYLINAIATLWPQAAFLHWYSLHSYYDPRAILVKGDLSMASIIVLGGLAIVCAAIAFRRFATRDLP
jgi:ABC-type transport system involved in multi-copper enzyme maturation permease subunit